MSDVDALWCGTVTTCRRGFYCPPQIVLVLVVVLVLDFLGRGKRTDCQQLLKIGNEDDDENEDDCGGKLHRANHIQGFNPGKKCFRE